MTFILRLGSPDASTVALEEEYDRNVRNFDAQENQIKSALTHRENKSTPDVSTEVDKLKGISHSLAQNGAKAKEEEKHLQGKWFSDKSGKRINVALKICTVLSAIASIAFTIWNAVANTKLSATIPAPVNNGSTPVPTTTEISCEFQQPWGPVIATSALGVFLLLLFFGNQAYDSNKKSIKKLKKINQDEITRRKTIADTLAAVESLKSQQSTQINVGFRDCCVLISSAAPQITPSRVTQIDSNDLIYLMAINLPKGHPFRKNYQVAAGNVEVLDEKEKQRDDDGRRESAEKRGSLLVLKDADGGVGAHAPAAAAANAAHLESAEKARIEPIDDEEKQMALAGDLSKEVQQLRALIAIEEATGITINRLYSNDGRVVGRNLKPVRRRVTALAGEPPAEKPKEEV